MFTYTNRTSRNTRRGAQRASDPHALPNVEVFYIDNRTAQLAYERSDLSNELSEPGWYWWSCFPGCMPDGPANGPYLTEQEAIAACQFDNSYSIE